MRAHTHTHTLTRCQWAVNISTCHASRHTLLHTHTQRVSAEHGRKAKTLPLAYLQFVGLQRAFDIMAFVAYFCDCNNSNNSARESGNVLFQLRFAEMQLKTCNLFDVLVFLYEFVMPWTSTPANGITILFVCLACWLRFYVLVVALHFACWRAVSISMWYPLIQLRMNRAGLSYYLPFGLLVFKRKSHCCRLLHSYTHTHVQKHT